MPHIKGFNFKIVFLMLVLSGILNACANGTKPEATTTNLPSVPPSPLPTLPNADVRIYWSMSLADESVNAPQGEFPKNMLFSLSTWAMVTAGE